MGFLYDMLVWLHFSEAVKNIVNWKYTIKKFHTVNRAIFERGFSIIRLYQNAFWIVLTFGKMMENYLAAAATPI